MARRVRKKRQNNNNIWEPFQADRSAPVNMLDLPSVTDYLPEERTRATLREYDPGVVETISRAVGLMGGDTRSSHRFADKVAGLADWTPAGDVDAIEMGANMISQARPGQSVTQDFSWSDAKDMGLGAGIMGLGALGILAPGPSAKNVVKPQGQMPRGVGAKKRADTSDIKRRTDREGMGVRAAARERVGTTGQYVGAPAGVDTPEKLDALRQDYIDSVVEGIKGREWYRDSSRFINDVAPLRPGGNQQVADVLGVTSQGTGVDSNLGFSIKGINQRAAGDDVATGRFPGTQSPLIERILKGDNPNLGPKREPFAANLSVDWNPDIAVHPVHDIWDGRAWGFSKPDGSPWDGAFSPQQHDFMDKQAQFVADYLNKNKVGGFDDWDALNTQAAAWTGKQIKMGALDPSDAAKHYGDNAAKYQAFATYEQTPGVGTGHMEGLAGMDYEDRLEFGGLAPWLNDKGQDSIYSSGGLLTEKTVPNVGAYTPAGGVLEINPGEVGRPLVQMKNNELLPEGRAMLNAGESARAFVDTQNAGAWHKVIDGAPAGQRSSLAINLPDNATPEQMAALSDVADRNGFFAVDTGSGGVNLINDPYSTIGKDRTGKSLGVEMKKTGLLDDVRDAAGTAVKIERVKAETGYIDYQDLWASGPGSGQATDKFISDMEALPNFAESIEPSLREKAAANLKRNREFAQGRGLLVRDDVQEALSILADKGIDGLKKALKSGAVLPAVGAAVLSPALLSEGQSDG
jgi:hypothetical protein